MVLINNRVAIVIPNWNGEDFLGKCLDSVLKQEGVTPTIIVVENGSIDSSLKILKSYGNKIITLEQPENLGFAGGVNVGIKYALENKFDFIGLLNNDATVDTRWLMFLLNSFEENENIGIVTSKILIGQSGRLDSTGDWYSTTGMPFPRGRGETDSGQYDKKINVFGASGGASLYRAKLFDDIGLFDEDFFAYYEDVDLSFRAQLRSWRVKFQPKALVYHALSATSSKLGYFAIKQSAKNFWLIYIKNLPTPLLFKYLPSALYRYSRMFAARIIKGGFWAFFSGFIKSLTLFPKKIRERRYIQKRKTVSNQYLVSMIHKGKPPLVDNTHS